MYYGYHIIEALASFEKATQFDEKFAMGHWGKALAYGPNINDLGYAASPDALASVNCPTRVQLLYDEKLEADWCPTATQPDALLLLHAKDPIATSLLKLFPLDAAYPPITILLSPVVLFCKAKYPAEIL